ncbi:MAG: hypothetical protein GH158_03105, partial [Dehalococcoidia bacterium]|nr:hypothetical protein [Dehalococcoidia bacterium]
EKPQEGEVVAVGPGRLSDDGKRIAMDVKVADLLVLGGDSRHLSNLLLVFDRCRRRL